MWKKTRHRRSVSRLRLHAHVLERGEGVVTEGVGLLGVGWAAPERRAPRPFRDVPERSGGAPEGGAR